MYRVIKYFKDLQDNNHAYNVGDEFPHKGMEVSEKRLLELSTDANRRHLPLIEKVADEPEQPDDDFMNPPEEPEEAPEEPIDDSKPKKKRGRPRNDAK